MIRLCPALDSLPVEELIPKGTGVDFRMAKEEPLSTSKDLKELQKKLSLLVESIQNNSKVSFRSGSVMKKSPNSSSLKTHRRLFFSEVGEIWR